MKILNLTKSNAEIEFSINEITIVKNSLVEIYQQVNSTDFKRRIEGLSRENFLELSKIFSELAKSSQESFKSTLKNNFIQVKKITENQISLDLTYLSVISIRSALFEVCDGIDLQNFEEKIESTRMNVSNLMGLIGGDVIQKMQEGTPNNLVFKRTIELAKELNFSRDNLKSKIDLPIFVRICQLKFKSHILIFRLSSFKKRTIFSGIRIAFGNILESFDFFSKSDFQFIRHDDLVSLIAYLELTTKSVISNEDLKDFEFSKYNSKYSICFGLQVLPKNSETEDLRIRLRLPLRSLEDENLTDVLEVEDFIDTKNVNSFIKEIRSFLTDLLIVGREN
jgi:hypothetical protein